MAPLPHAPFRRGIGAGIRAPLKLHGTQTLRRPYPLLHRSRAPAASAAILARQAHQPLHRLIERLIRPVHVAAHLPGRPQAERLESEAELGVDLEELRRARRHVCHAQLCMVVHDGGAGQRAHTVPPQMGRARMAGR